MKLYLVKNTPESEPDPGEVTKQAALKWLQKTREYGNDLESHAAYDVIWALEGGSLTKTGERWLRMVSTYGDQIHKRWARVVLMMLGVVP